jgi:hypothetical protein
MKIIIKTLYWSKYNLTPILFFYGYPERYYVVPVRYYVVPDFFRVLWYYGRVLYSTRGYYRPVGYYGYCAVPTGTTVVPTGTTVLQGTTGTTGTTVLQTGTIQYPWVL